MADKQIVELPSNQAITSETLFPAYQPGAVDPAQKVTGAQLSKFAEDAGRAAAGDIARGATFTPVYDPATGTLGWENDAGLPNPDPALLGGVSSFNGRAGAVKPQSGDYTAEMVGALALDGGGTVNSPNIAGVTLKRSYANVGSALAFANNGGVLGHFGVSADKKPMFYETDVTKGHGVILDSNIRDYAAPAGFGLGGAKKISVAELNGTTEPGWYYISGESMTVCGLTSSYWYLRVDGYATGDNHCYQTLYCTISHRFKAERGLYSGVWEEWGIANPPMQVGVEYRTPYRDNAKPEFWRLIEVAALPNATHGYTDTGITTNANIVSFEGVGTEPSGWKFGFPYFNNGVFKAEARLTSQNQLLIYTTADLSACSASFLIKYTKN